MGNYTGLEDKILFRNFDETDADTNVGSAKKQFQLCYGGLLKPMYQDIKSDYYTNYVTCVDYLIHYGELEEFLKSWISVIKKTDRGEDNQNLFVKAELVCSRVANLLGVKTAYVAPIEGVDNQVLSVDFLQNIPVGSNHGFKQQHFITMSELSTQCFLNTKSYVSDWMRILCLGLSSERFNALSTEQKDKIITDFIRLFIVKAMVFDDNDLHGDNIGLVYTEEDFSDLSLAPGYDYEYCLGNTCNFIEKYLQKPADYIAKNFEFLVNNFPNHTNIAMQSLKINDNLLAKISQIVDKFAGNEETARIFYFIITRRLKEVNNKFNEYANNNNFEK